MSSRIPRSFIDDLLARVDIVELVNAHVPLKKTGSNFVARCPFHTEKNPSFSVNRAKQFYYCFGCGAGGNAISFLMDFSHLDFVEAIEDLASFAGVQVQKEVVSSSDAFLPQAQSDKQSLQAVYVVLQQVAELYAQQLYFSPAAKKAAVYLKNRQVNTDFAKHFLLGYAPEAWQFLEEKFSKADLLEAGLLIAKEDGKGYDRFRGRLMFPIRDRRGRVVGFGARVLDDSLPKYLNSPETPVFQKGREVYGLFELLSKQTRPARILIVEGYMDVVALVQAGIDYVVATLGTATSRMHLDLLFRYTSEIVLCFDGDNAGRQAAWRAMDIVFECLKEGRLARVMLLPQGFDPDTLVKEEGRGAFERRIEQSQSLSEYFFEQLSLSVDTSNIEGRAKLVEAAKPFLSKLPEGILRDMMYARLNELTGLPQGALKRVPEHAVMVSKAAARPQQDKGRMSIARTVIALLLHHPNLIDSLERRDIEWDELDFSGLALLRKIAYAIVSINNQNAMSTAVVVEGFRGTQDYKTIVALAALTILTPEDGVQQEFCDGLDGLLKQARENRVAQLLEKSKVVDLNEHERETLKKMIFK